MRKHMKKKCERACGTCRKHVLTERTRELHVLDELIQHAIFRIEGINWQSHGWSTQVRPRIQPIKTERHRNARYCGSQFTPNVLRLKFNQGGAGIRTSKDQSFFLNTVTNFGPQMIDSTDAKGATKWALFNVLNPTFGERSFDESNKNNVGRNSLQTARGTGPLCETSGYHCSSNTPCW
jgi:hypothetical protein